MNQRYTCTEYRQEMVLLSLKRQLAAPGLNGDERQRIEKEIRKLEKEMGMS